MTEFAAGWPVFAQGWLMMAGLIVAIGAQNALVLRQGLGRSHVGAVVAFCAVSDVLLIAAGVFGFARLVSASPTALAVLRWGGAAYLAGYGLLALRRALHPAGGLPAATARGTLRAALTTAAALTWVNPHVYLDTVVLLGGVGAQLPAPARVPFALGAGTASVMWFVGLGYGAAALAPWLARPIVWRVIDAAIAVVMFAVAWQLVGTGVARA